MDKPNFCLMAPVLAVSPSIVSATVANLPDPGKGKSCSGQGQGPVFFFWAGVDAGGAAAVHGLSVDACWRKALRPLRLSVLMRSTPAAYNSFQANG